MSSSTLNGTISSTLLSQRLSPLVSFICDGVATSLLLLNVRLVDVLNYLIGVVFYLVGKFVFSTEYCVLLFYQLL